MFAVFQGWLNEAFGKFAGFFGLGMLRKTIAIGAAVTLLGSLTLALWAFFETQLSSLAVAVPSEIVSVASWVVPTNIEEAIAVVITLRVARFIYDFNAKTTDTRLT